MIRVGHIEVILAQTLMIQIRSPIPMDVMVVTPILPAV